MGCEMTRNAKIMWIIGGVFSLVAAIILIAGVVVGKQGTSIGYEVKQQKSATWEVEAKDGGGTGWSMNIYIKHSDWASCDDAVPSTTITDPNDDVLSISSRCSLTSADGTEKADDPRMMGTFQYNDDDLGNEITGTYRVESDYEVWILDAAEVLGEAVGGIFAAMGIMMTGLAVSLVAAILCCVACCCMCTNSA